jgi:hypothetical protein
MDYYMLKEKRTLSIKVVEKVIEKEKGRIDEETGQRGIEFIYALANLAIKVELKGRNQTMGKYDPIHAEK